MKRFKLCFLRNFAPKAYRYIVYEWMLEYFLVHTDVRNGFCYVIQEYQLTINRHCFLHQMVELLKYKPPKKEIIAQNNFWFPKTIEGRERRIEILKEILGKN